MGTYGTDSPKLAELDDAAASDVVSAAAEPPSSEVEMSAAVGSSVALQTRDAAVRCRGSVVLGSWNADADLSTDKERMHNTRMDLVMLLVLVVLVEHRGRLQPALLLEADIEPSRQP